MTRENGQRNNMQFLVVGHDMTLSKCALWVEGQFKTGNKFILEARVFPPSVDLQILTIS